jgi:cytochrome b6-f complex iron-sulfur subunit
VDGQRGDKDRPLSDSEKETYMVMALEGLWKLEGEDALEVVRSRSKDTRSVKVQNAAFRILEEAKGALVRRKARDPGTAPKDSISPGAVETAPGSSAPDGKSPPLLPGREPGRLKGVAPMADTKTKAPPGKPATTRRSFLERVGVGWALFTGASAAGFSPRRAFCSPTTFSNLPRGSRSASPPTSPRPRTAPSTSASRTVTPSGSCANLGEFYVLSTVCTHLGCTPNWLSAERKFKCPCHGSGFYVTGINFEGPAPRPLERFRISLAPDGQIEVDKSQKYQQELGQWLTQMHF